MEHLKSIYRNYDIRGQYPGEINEDQVRRIGQALVTIYNATQIVVGHDYRPSATPLMEALIDGITSQGCNVIHVGLVTTPMLYFASGTTDTQVAVMLTASHMPAGFNGLKICVDNAVPIGLDSGLEKVRDVAHGSSATPADNPGTVTERDIAPAWRAHLASLIDFSGQDVTKAVVDPANMVGTLELETLKQFTPPLAVESIYTELDANTPHHEANPMKTETLTDLGMRVQQTGADLGIAFDGDADRIGIVDETGEAVSQDVIGALLAEEILKRNGNRGTIVFDVRSSRHVAEVIESAGGTAVPYRIGHTYIRRKMRDLNALYALELSGHHFFKDTFYSEAGIYPALLLISVLRESGRKLSELVAEHHVYHHSGEINSTVTRTPDEIYERLRDVFSDATFDTIDGLTIAYKNWWCNVRPSANDPVMRLNLEATTERTMTDRRDRVLEVIRS